jgi:hypothetical protein
MRTIEERVCMKTLQHEAQQIEETPQESEQASVSHGYNIEAVRDLARKAFPDTIPELISGESYDEVMASVERARAAYARIFMEVEERQTVVKAPVVPAGGSSAPVVDLERLPAAEKLRRGVGEIRRRDGETVRR